MVKNYLLLIFSLTLSITVLGQIARERQGRNDSFSKQLKHGKFNRINKGKTFSNFHINNKQAYQKLSQDIKKQRFDSFINQRWDESVNQWKNDYKEEYIYDTNGHIMQYLSYDWNHATNQWYLEDWGVEFAYDSNGNVIRETVHEGSWIWKFEYTYDNGQNIIQIVSSDFNSSTNQWITASKSVPTYDTNGNTTIVVGSGWNNTTSQWEVRRKTEYSYNPINKLTGYMEYDWNNTTSQWENNGNSRKEEYSYDTNGNMTLIVEFFEYSTSESWRKSRKREFSYDTNDNMIQSVYSDWYNNSWKIYKKYECSYDNTYSFSDLIIPYFFNNFFYSDYKFFLFFNHKLTTSIDSDRNESSNNWEITDKAFFYYSEQNILSVSEINDSEFNVYPNPAYDVLTINSKLPITKVEIYSILGQKVKEIDKSFNSIPLNSLDHGIYLLRIESENGFAVKKLIKQ